MHVTGNTVQINGQYYGSMNACCREHGEQCGYDHPAADRGLPRRAEQPGTSTHRFPRQPHV